MVNVLITVDTECSLGGAWRGPDFVPVGADRAVLGKVGNTSYGTPLIMDILETNGLRGVFFLEMFAGRVVDELQLWDAYRSIVQRGHDVQLHLHPVYRYFHLVQQGLMAREQLPENMDAIGSHGQEQQVAFLEEGREIFEKVTGKTPVAFRAGSYAASLDTLRALHKVGIRYDSSFNAAYIGNCCLFHPRSSPNNPWRHDDVVEVPITNFRTGLWGFRGLKPFEVGSVSWQEMLTVLQDAERLGLNTVTAILHSFSFVKPADVQFRDLRPDRLVIARFKKLCRYLRDHSDRFRVTTFSDLKVGEQEFSSAPVPGVGFLMPGVRKLVQGVNRLHWI